MTDSKRVAKRIVLGSRISGTTAAGMLILIIILVFIAYVFLSPVLELMRIILILFLVPPLMKVFGDGIGKQALGLDPALAVATGLILTIPALIVLWINFWLLFYSAIILVAIFILGTYLGFQGILKGNARNLVSLVSWFESAERGRRSVSK